MSRHSREGSQGEAAHGGEQEVPGGGAFSPTNPEAAHLPSNLSEAIKAAEAAGAAEAAEAEAVAALAAAAAEEEKRSREKAEALTRALAESADAAEEPHAKGRAKKTLRPVDDAARIKVLQKHEETPEIAQFRSGYKLDAPADDASPEAAPADHVESGLAIRQNMGMSKAEKNAPNSGSENDEDVPVVDFEILDAEQPAKPSAKKTSRSAPAASLGNAGSGKEYSTRISGASGNGRKSWNTDTRSGAEWTPRKEDAAIVIDAPGNDRPQKKEKAKKESDPARATNASLSGAESGPESITKNTDPQEAFRMDAKASDARRVSHPERIKASGRPLAAAEAAPAKAAASKPKGDAPARPAGTPSIAPPSEAAKAYAASAARERSLAGKAGQALLSPFKAIGRAAGNGVSGIGSWIKFQLNRTKDNLFLDHRNDKAGQFAEKVEGEKSRLDIAKARAEHIRSEIKAIDDQRSQNKDLVTPKIAKKMEHDRRELEMRLIEAESIQDKASRKLQKREAQMMYHENKRTQIAQHYEQMVDDRFRPVAEKKRSLQDRKDQYQSEIAEWDAQVSSYEEKAKAIEEKARKNPYLTSVFKAQLKEVRKAIDASRKEIAKRRDAITGVFGIDAKLIGVSAKLQKWEDRKAMYSRIASRQGSRSAEESAVVDPSGSLKYRDPLERGSPADAAEAKADGSESQSDQAESSEEVPSAFSYDEWVSQWNALNGSKLKLDADTMFDAATVRRYRESGPGAFTKDEFAGIVKVFLRKPEVSAMTKVKSREVASLAGGAVERLRAKAAAAAAAEGAAADA